MKCWSFSNVSSCAFLIVCSAGMISSIIYTVLLALSIMTKSKIVNYHCSKVSKMLFKSLKYSHRAFLSFHNKRICVIWRTLQTLYILQYNILDIWYLTCQIEWSLHSNKQKEFTSNIFLQYSCRLTLSLMGTKFMNIICGVGEEIWPPAPCLKYL